MIHRVPGSTGAWKGQTKQSAPLSDAISEDLTHFFSTLFSHIHTFNSFLPVPHIAQEVTLHSFYIVFSKSRSEPAGIKEGTAVSPIALFLSPLD